MRRAVAVAAAATFIVLIAPIFAGWYYHGLDLTRVDLGVLCAIRRQLESGGGLWLSPFLGDGGPLFARPDALLAYPPRWPALLLPEDLGTAWGVLFHLTVAAAGVTLLCGSFRVRPAIAALAAGAFVLSGTTLDLILHANYIVAAAWLPLVWAMSRALASPRGRPRHVVGLVAGLGLLLLGGEPQAFGIGAALVLFETGATLVTRGRRAWRPVALALGSIVAAFSIGLVQWLPTLAEMALTPRREALTPAKAFMWSFIPVTWPAVIFPGFLTEPARPFTNLWAIYAGDMGTSFPWNREPYLGALFLAVLVCGLSLRASRRPAVVLGVGLVFALGSVTPILPGLAKLVPLVTLFRYPAKYLVVATLAAVVVVALFASTLHRRPTSRRHFVWAGSIILAFEAVTLLWIVTTADGLDRMAEAMPATVSIGDLPALHTLLAWMILQSAAPLGLALVAVLLVPRLRPWVLAFVVADLLFAAPTALNLGPSLADLTSALAQNLPEDPPPVLCIDPHLRSTSFQRDDVYSRWGEIVHSRALPDSELNACDGLRAAVPYSALQSSTSMRLEEGLEHHRAAAARALGCTHLIADVAPREGTAAPLPATPWLESFERLVRGRVYRLAEPLPEAFVSPAPTFVHGDHAVVVALSATRTAAGALAVVDAPLSAATAGSELPRGDTASITSLDRPRADRATLHLQGTGGAVVGLKTAYLVGWSAWQGDRELRTVRVAGTHLAVVVDDVAAGDVELSYAPPRLGLGLVGTGVGLVLALGLSVVFRRTRRAPAPRR